MDEYSIRDVSEMFQLPPSTLRYYEEQGLITGVRRTPSGQRVYEQKHINRLRTICCFKHTGMSMTQLKQFFACEADEPAHIDDVLTLLRGQKVHVEQQMEELGKAYAHVLRKLHYYSDIKKSLDAGLPLPEWKDYRNRQFAE